MPAKIKLSPGDRIYTTKNVKTRWTFLKDIIVGKARKVRVKCDCGTIKKVRLGGIRGGGSLSCGCLCIEAVTTHGARRSPEYKLLMNIKGRCHVSSPGSYQFYGALGVEVGDEWRNDPAKFISYVKTLPNYAEWLASKQSGYEGPAYQIDRIDNDGHYVPGNIRLVKEKVNKRNRSDNLYVTLTAKDQDWTSLKTGDYLAIALYEWYSKHPNLYGELIPKDISCRAMYARLYLGWHIYDALFCARLRK